MYHCCSTTNSISRALESLIGKTSTCAVVLVTLLGKNATGGGLGGAGGMLFSKANRVAMRAERSLIVALAPVPPRNPLPPPTSRPVVWIHQVPGILNLPIGILRRTTTARLIVPLNSSREVAGCTPAVRLWRPRQSPTLSNCGTFGSEGATEWRGWLEAETTAWWHRAGGC